MKRVWIGVVVAMLAVTLLPAGASEAAKPWIDKLAESMSKAYKCNYVADMDVQQMGQSMQMNMAGDLAQADVEHYRGQFTMTMKSPMMPEAMEMSVVMVADGTTSWMEMDNPMMGGKTVMKISLGDIERLAKINPQIKGMQDMNPGAALRKMTEVFDVELVGIADGKVTLSADMSAEALAEVMGTAGAAGAPEELRNMTLILEEKRGIPMEVRLGDPAMLSMRFVDFQFVSKDSFKDEFSYTPPEGTPVMDLGTMMGAASGGGS